MPKDKSRVRNNYVCNHNKYSCFDCLNSPVGPLQMHIHKEDGLYYYYLCTMFLCIYNILKNL